MNFVFRTALGVLLITTIANPSVAAMQKEIISRDATSKKELIAGIKELPRELKVYIIYLLFDSSMGWNFTRHKAFFLIDPCGALALNSDQTTFLVGRLSGQIFMGNIDTEAFTALPAYRREISCLALSPKRKTYLVGATSDYSRINKVKTGALLTTLYPHYDSEKLSDGEFRHFCQGHTEGISAVVFSPNGEMCLTGSKDKTACLWNSTTGKPIRSFIGHNKQITSVAFSPRGDLILTGSEDTTACVWSTKTGKVLTTLRGHTDGITSVAFSPDGEKVLTGSKDGTTCVWNHDSGKWVWNSKTGTLLITFKEHRSAVTCVAFGQTGETCLTGSAYGTVCLWSSTTGKLITTIAGHENSVYSVAFTVGETILTASLDGIVGVWAPCYGFSCLPQERKKEAFKQFLNLYPLLQEATDSCDELPNTSDSYTIPSIKEEESHEIKAIGRGLDINSGNQQNCSIS